MFMEKIIYMQFYIKQEELSRGGSSH
uniref:Uncharacterized protein n=1 Tax=Anguilla anguilla TaxID=7936 RepID=A0A0E9UK16_ANGAN